MTHTFTFNNVQLFGAQEQRLTCDEHPDQIERVVQQACAAEVDAVMQELHNRGLPRFYAPGYDIRIFENKIVLTAKGNGERREIPLSTGRDTLTDQAQRVVAKADYLWNNHWKAAHNPFYGMERTRLGESHTVAPMPSARPPAFHPHPHDSASSSSHAHRPVTMSIPAPLSTSAAASTPAATSPYARTRRVDGIARSQLLKTYTKLFRLGENYISKGNSLLERSQIQEMAEQLETLTELRKVTNTLIEALAQSNEDMSDLRDNLARLLDDIQAQERNLLAALARAPLATAERASSGFARPLSPSPSFDDFHAETQSRLADLRESMADTAQRLDEEFDSLQSRYPPFKPHAFPESSTPFSLSSLEVNPPSARSPSDSTVGTSSSRFASLAPGAGGDVQTLSNPRNPGPSQLPPVFPPGSDAEPYSTQGDVDLATPRARTPTSAPIPTPLSPPGAPSVGSHDLDDEETTSREGSLSPPPSRRLLIDTDSSSMYHGAGASPTDRQPPLWTSLSSLPLPSPRSFMWGTPPGDRSLDYYRKRLKGLLAAPRAISTPPITDAAGLTDAASGLAPLSLASLRLSPPASPVTSSEFHGAVVRHEEASARLQSELEALIPGEENAELRQRIQLLSAQIANLRAFCERLRDDNQRLIARLPEIGQAEEDTRRLDEYRAIIQENHQKIKQAEDHISKLERQLNEITDNLRDRDDQLAKALQNYKDARQDLDTLRNKLQSQKDLYEREAERTKEQLAYVTEQLDQAKAQVAEQRRAWDEAFGRAAEAGLPDHLERALKAEARVKVLEGENATLLSRLQELGRADPALESQFARVTSQLREAEDISRSQRTMIDNLTEELAKKDRAAYAQAMALIRAENTILTLEGRLERLKKAETQLAEELYQARNTFAYKSSEMEQDITTLQSQLRTARAQADEERRELQALIDQGNHALSSADLEINRLKSDLAQTRAEVIQADERVAEWQGKVEGLQAELDQKEGRLTSATQQLSDAEEEQTKLRQKVEELSIQLQETERNLIESQHRARSHEEALRRQENTITELNKELTDAQADKLHAHELLNALRSEHEKVKQQISELEENDKENRARIGELSDQATHSKDEAEKYRLDLETAQAKLAELNIELQRARAAESTAKEHVSDLEKQLDDAIAERQRVARQLEDSATRERDLRANIDQRDKALTEARSEIAHLGSETDRAKNAAQQANLEALEHKRKAEALQAELDAKEGELREAGGKIGHLKAEKIELERQSDALQRELKQANIGRERAEVEASKQQRQAEALAAELLKAQNALSIKTDQLQAAQVENAELQADREKEEEIIKDHIGLLNQELSEVNHKKKAADEQIAQLTEALAKAEEDKQQGERALTEADLFHTTLKTRLTDQEGHIDRLETRLREATASVERLTAIQEKITQAETARGQEQAKLQEQLHTITQAKIDADRDKEAFNNILETAEAERRRLTDELAASQAHLAELNTEHEKAAAQWQDTEENLNKQLRAANQRADEVDSEGTRLQGALTRAVEGNNQLSDQHEKDEESLKGLRAQLTLLQSVKEGVEASIEELTKKSEDARTEHDRKLASIRKALDTTQAENERQKAALVAQDAVIASLTEALQEERVRAANLDAQKDQLQKELDQTARNLETEKNAHTETRITASAAAESAGQENDYLRTKLVNITRDKAAAEASVEDLNGSLQGSRQEAKRLREELADSQKRLEEATQAIKAWEEQNNSLTQQRDKAQERVTGLESTQRHLETQLREAQGKISHLEEQYTADQGKLRAQKDKITSLTQELAAAQAAQAAAAKKEAELNQALREGGAATDHLTRLSEEQSKALGERAREIESLTDVHARTKAELDATNAHVTRLQTQLSQRATPDQFSKLEKELSKSQHRADQLQTKETEQQTVIGQLRHSLAELTTSASTTAHALEKAQRANAALETELRKLRSANHSAAKQAAETERALRLEIEQLSAGNEKYAQQLKAQTAATVAAQAQATSLQTKLAQQTKELEEAQAANTALQSDLAGSRIREQRLLADKDSLNGQLSEAQARSAELHTSIDEAKTRIAALGREHEAQEAAHKRELEELQGVLSKTKEAIQEKERTIEGLHTLLAEKTREAETSRAGREQAKAEIAKLNEEIAQISENTADLRSICKDQEDFITRINQQINEERVGFEAQRSRLEHQLAELTQRLEASEKKRAEDYHKLTLALEKIKELEAQLTTASKVTETATQRLDEMTKRAEAAEAENRHLRSLLAARVTTLSSGAIASDADTIAALKALPRITPRGLFRAGEKAFLDVPELIKEGHIDILLPFENICATVDLVSEALDEILTPPENPDPHHVYNLAIYVANGVPHIPTFKNTELFQKLQAWIIRRAGRLGRETDPLLERKQRTLLLTLANDASTLCGQIAVPMLRAAQYHAALNMNGISKKEWARNLIMTERLTPEQQHIKGLLLDKLTEADKIAPALEIQMSMLVSDGFSRLHMVPVSLHEQYLGLPDQTLHHGIIGIHKTLEWSRAFEQRQYLIDNVINDFNFDTITDDILQSSRAKEEDHLLTGTYNVIEPLLRRSSPRDPPTITDQLVAARDSGKPISEDTRIALKTQVEGRIRFHLQNLTGLQTLRTTPEVLMQYVQANGKFPIAIQQALLLQGGDAALVLSQLLYYYNALHDAPKHDFFRHIASLDQWDWLVQGLGNEEASKQILKLLQALKNHEKFEGLPASAQQADWARDFSILLTDEQCNPPYIDAEAGSGKTGLCHLIVEFIKTALPETQKKRVILYSPFATSIPGMECRLLDEDKKQNVIFVESEEELRNVAVVVDEADMLPVDAEFVVKVWNEEDEERVRRSENITLDGCTTRIVRPLKMSATKIKPYKGYAQHKVRARKASDKAATFQETFDGYGRNLSREIQSLNKQREEEIAYLRNKEVIRQAHMLDTMLANFGNPSFKQYVTAAQRSPLKEAIGNLKKDLDKIKDGFQTDQHAGLGARIDELRNRLEDIITTDYTPATTTGAYTFLGMPPKEFSAALTKTHEGNKKQVETTLKDLLTFKAWTQTDVYRECVRGSGELPKIDRRLKDLTTAYQELGAKRTSWTRKATKEAAEGLASMQSRGERAKHVATKMSYETSERVDFDPRRDGASVANKLVEKSLANRAQVIMPDVRFTEESLPLFIEAAKDALISKQATRQPVFFVYHDSHSNPDTPGSTYGKDIIMGYDENGHRLSTLGRSGKQDRLTLKDYWKEQRRLAEIEYRKISQPTIHSDDFIERHLKHVMSQQTTIMLYDTTTKQGGDFGAWSRAESENDILQVIYYNISTKGRDPAEVVSTDALYQAMSRRRGSSAQNSAVVGSCSEEEFSSKLALRQTTIEQGRAVYDVPAAIARKIIKASTILKNPMIVAPKTAKLPAGPLVSGWKVIKAKELRKQNHDAMTKRALAYLKNEDSDEAQTFAREWQQFEITIENAIKGNEGDSQLPLVERMLQAADGDQNLWKAHKAFEEARYLINWAKGYSPVTADSVLLAGSSARLSAAFASMPSSSLSGRATYASMSHPSSMKDDSKEEARQHPPTPGPATPSIAAGSSSSVSSTAYYASLGGPPPAAGAAPLPSTRQRRGSTAGTSVEAASSPPEGSPSRTPSTKGKFCLSNKKKQPIPRQGSSAPIERSATSSSATSTKGAGGTTPATQVKADSSKRTQVPSVPSSVVTGLRGRHTSPEVTGSDESSIRLGRDIYTFVSKPTGSAPPAVRATAAAGAGARPPAKRA